MVSRPVPASFEPGLEIGRFVYQKLLVKLKWLFLRTDKYGDYLLFSETETISTFPVAISLQGTYDDAKDGRFEPPTVALSPTAGLSGDFLLWDDILFNDTYSAWNNGWCTTITQTCDVSKYNNRGGDGQTRLR